MTRLPTFHVGDRAEDKDTHKRGTIVHVYSRQEMHEEIVCVRFAGEPQAFAIPADCLRKLNTARKCRATRQRCA